ncbi:MAG: sel1 repeat family protein [Deltaproteobacteria bacterium]|nr:sel1 repeat family protein [Deltaproteobacteria bacterium]
MTSVRALALLCCLLFVPTLAVAQSDGGSEESEEEKDARKAEKDAGQGGQAEGRGETIEGDVVGEKDDGTLIIAVESPIEELEGPCAEGDGDKCYEAGMLWYRGQVPGQDGRPNYNRAANLLQAACAFRNVDGCMAVARMYLDMQTGMRLIAPEGTPSVDLGGAAEALRFACEAGRFDACGLMGDIYVNPASKVAEGALFHNIKQDFFYAAQSYQGGCNADDYPDPRDVRPDGSVDARSCARLGELHEQGAGVMLSPKLAAEHYERACRAGLTAICEKADGIKQAIADGTYVSPGERVRQEREDPGSRGDGHLASIKPDTERFKDDSLGIEDRKKEDGVRLDIVGMLGSRWFYGPPRTLGGIKWKGGFTVWVKLIGFGLETGFNTDRLFLVDERYFARYAHAFMVKGTFPIPIRLPIPAVVGLGIGAGPTIGHQRWQDTPFWLVYGAREYVQVWISTAQRRGPRQWGAFRFEQQQTWLTNDSRLEHSSQILFLFGFTFGGVAPEYPRGGGRPKDEITGRTEPRPNWD